LKTAVNKQGDLWSLDKLNTSEDDVIDALRLTMNCLRGAPGGNSQKCLQVVEKHTQVQEFIIVIDPITKKKLCQASLGQSQVEVVSVLIVVCSNTSRSVNRYRKEAQISIVLSMVRLLL
jgi:hypothetical protein